MKTIFVDLDNTLAANETCQNVEFTKGLYLNKKTYSNCYRCYMQFI